MQSSRTRFRPLTLALALAWPVAALLMLTASGADSYDPSASRYGYNWPGDLPEFLKQAAIETAVLVLVLRPWSAARSGWRFVLALVLFLPWTALSVVVGMHGGPIMHMHELWLLIVCVGLIGGLMARAKTKRRNAGSAPAHAALRR